MKVRTNALIGESLNWAAGVAEGYAKQIAVTGYGNGEEEAFFAYPVRDDHDEIVHARGDRWKPSTDWSQGGPIIERMFGEGLELVQGAPDSGNQRCWAKLSCQADYSHGPTPLIAAMRCYVASVLGVEVDIPVELLS